MKIVNLFILILALAISNPILSQIINCEINPYIGRSCKIQSNTQCVCPDIQLCFEWISKDSGSNENSETTITLPDGEFNNCPGQVDIPNVKSIDIYSAGVNSTFICSGQFMSFSTSYPTSLTFENFNIFGSGKSSPSGGGIYAEYTGTSSDPIITISQCEIKRFTSEEAGGFLYLSGYNLFMASSTISYCSSSGNGGAIFIGGSTSTDISKIVSSTFNFNYGMNGGAVYSSRPNTMISCANFNNNTASISGGALFTQGSSLNVEYSNFMAIVLAWIWWGYFN